MKKLAYYLITLIFFILTNSCQDYLDRKPLDKFSDAAVWEDLYLMETFVNGIYYNIYHGFDGKIGMQTFSDEAVRTADRGASNVARSLVTPTDMHAYGQRGQVKLRWDRLYSNVRRCNLFLSKVDENTYDDESFKNRLKGEVLFLRGYINHQLAKQYGGVIKIDRAYNLDDDFLAHRNSFSEIIDFIVNDLDAAAELLPLEHTGDNVGRATKGAALAIKARVLLYAASDLFNDQSWAQGYSNPELIGFTDGNREARWRAAKNAAKAVMDLGVYDLHKKDPAENADIVENLTEIFLLKQTSEDIFVRFFNFESWEGSETYHPGLHHMSGGYHAHGSNNPVGQMVDAFEMIDGTKFDWNNPTHKAAPYENRDPRFYSSILFDGVKWRERTEDAVSIDPIGIIQTGFYEQPDGSFRGGLDTRQSVLEDWNGTQTGYYQRKYIDPSVPFNLAQVTQECPWRYVRFTEILLSYAEACNELGEDEEARRVINMIRNRAGMPPINSDGSQLKEDIRHERNVELMFEGQRYWDIRRWMIAPDVMVNATGIYIKHFLNGETEYEVLPNVKNRAWLNRSYFMPIELNEMNKNDKLIQNPLYD